MAQQSEASVEEILDSIKKVIARDNLAWALEKRRQRQTLGVVSEDDSEQDSDDYADSGRGEEPKTASAPNADAQMDDSHTSLNVDAALQPSNDHDEDAEIYEAGGHGTIIVEDVDEASDNVLDLRSGSQQAASAEATYSEASDDNADEDVDEDTAEIETQAVEASADEQSASPTKSRKKARGDIGENSVGEGSSASCQAQLSRSGPEGYIEESFSAAISEGGNQLNMQTNPGAARDSSLISGRARAAMKDNLAALAMASAPQEQPNPAPSTASETSLEGLVREMLRPMLAEWLDNNLPDMIERLVREEIQRITGKEG